MRIERLTLRGLLKVREPLTIDVTDVPNGLIAVVGENGAGKSTLLEAAPAALYRSFLSRGDLVDYATLPDSSLEVQFVLDGRGAYRARVSLDGLKRASQAVLEQILPDGSRRPLTDGKVSTYDQAIAALVPSKALLLASAFAAQNKAGSFIALDKKARKTLFMQLLGIERYEAMASTARQAALLVETTRAKLAAVRDELARGAGDDVLQAIDAEAQRLQVVWTHAEADRVTAAAAIERLEAQLATMADAQAAYGAAQLRVSTLRSDLAARYHDRQHLLADAERDRRAFEADELAIQRRRDAEIDAIAQAVRQADRGLEQELATIDATLATDRTNLANRIAGNERIREMGDQIRAAVATLDGIDGERRSLEAAAAADGAALIEARAELSELEQQLRALDTPLAQLARARQDAAILSTVPCGGTGPYAPCAFLVNATAAQTAIPTLSETITHRRSAIEPALAAQRSVVAALEDRGRPRPARLAQLEAERTAAMRVAKYSDALAAAEARIAELQTAQQKADDDAQAARTAATARHEARRQELRDREAASASDAEAQRAALVARRASAIAAREDREATLDLTIGRLELALHEAEADLAAAADGDQAAARMRADLSQARRAWDDLTARIATLTADQQHLARRRQEADAARARLAGLTGRVDRLTTELLEWQLLAKAFSRDGLPVLEIDAAGPTISALTNDLLAACFGSRFSVELVTQQLKADGKGLKESFTVAVTDNSTGDARDIADLSGGEQVIVSEALMAATGIYVNTRSTAPIRTCWRDETTGALDSENAARYCAMLRKAHELGGFHHTWFISHNPDIAAMADVQVHVHDGRAALVWPPFTREVAA